MANYCAKGKEYMRELGGLKSGERRRLNRVGRIIGLYALEKGNPMPLLVHEMLPMPGIAAEEPNRSGGSHDSDWRCVNPECRHFNSIKRRACAKCRTPGPWNGRMTRKRLRERAEEGRIAAILDKHGLS